MLTGIRASGILGQIATRPQLRLAPPEIAPERIGQALRTRFGALAWLSARLLFVIVRHAYVYAI